MQGELRAASDRTNAFEEQLNNLRAAYEALQGQTASSADAAQYQAQLEELIGERDTLATRLANLEQALAEANAGHSAAAALAGERDELAQKLETATQELAAAAEAARTSNSG